MDKYEITAIIFVILWALGEAYLDEAREKAGKRINHQTSAIARAVSWVLLAGSINEWTNWGGMIAMFLALGFTFWLIFDYAKNFIHNKMNPTHQLPWHYLGKGSVMDRFFKKQPPLPVLAFKIVLFLCSWMLYSDLR